MVLLIDGAKMELFRRSKIKRFANMAAEWILTHFDPNGKTKSEIAAFYIEDLDELKKMHIDGEYACLYLLAGLHVMDKRLSTLDKPLLSILHDLNLSEKERSERFLRLSLMRQGISQLPLNTLTDAPFDQVSEKCLCDPPPWYHLPPKETATFYNCSGLATREYTILSDRETEQAIARRGANKVSCGIRLKPCSIKYKLWWYDIEFVETLSDNELFQHTGSINARQNADIEPLSRDFHVVSGMLDCYGNESANVYSKYGIGNPVRGPGHFDDFAPGESIPEVILEAMGVNEETLKTNLWAAYVHKRPDLFFSPSNVPANARIIALFQDDVYPYEGKDNYLEDANSYIEHLASKGISTSDVEIGFTRLQMKFDIISSQCYGESNG